MPGIPELLLILLIVLLVFGAGKLPQIGDAIGRSIKNFKRASKGEDEIEVAKKGELEGQKLKSSKVLSDGDDDVEEAEVLAAKRAKAKKEA